MTATRRTVVPRPNDDEIDLPPCYLKSLDGRSPLSDLPPTVRTGRLLALLRLAAEFLEESGEIDEIDRAWVDRNLHARTPDQP